MTRTHEIAGHRIKLLRNGEEYFPRLIDAIYAAQHSIYLETYIFAPDHTGRLVKEALQAAAARQVKVHVLLDGHGAADFPSKWVNDLRMLGVSILWFRPEISALSLRRQRLRRLHRKLVLIDEVSAFIGGINIVDDADKPGGAPRLDYAVSVQGPVVTEIAHVMQQLWQRVAWTNLRRSGHRVAWGKPKMKMSKVALLIRDNLRHRRDIERAYLQAISQAQKEIVIANAYFLPGRRFRKVLVKAAQRGVRVVLLLQGKVEHPLQHYATLALYDELLRAGIEIYEYTQSYLHAKVAVVDQHWVTVGSSNIDPFSLWLAREANLVVQDSVLAEELRASLQREIQVGAQRVTQLDWQRRSVYFRIVLRGSYGLVRMLAGLSGYAHHQDDI